MRAKEIRQVMHADSHPKYTERIWDKWLVIKPELKLKEETQLYWLYRDDRTGIDGIVMKDLRIVVPTSL